MFVIATENEKVISSPADFIARNTYGYTAPHNSLTQKE
jgi:hypothetical protein